MHFAQKFRNLQSYGRKFTGAVQHYGRKFHTGANIVSNHILTHASGPYSEAVGHAIKNAGEFANNLANSANALDRNQPIEALQHLGFN
jgi:hypothetical protein